MIYAEIFLARLKNLTLTFRKIINVLLYIKNTTVIYMNYHINPGTDYRNAKVVKFRSYQPVKCHPTMRVQ